jgi:hypothetical protein
MRQIFTIFAEREKSPLMQMLIISRYNEKKTTSCTESASTGHREQMSAEPILESNSDAKDKERSGMDAAQ